MVCVPGNLIKQERSTSLEVSHLHRIFPCLSARCGLVGLSCLYLKT